MNSIFPTILLLIIEFSNGSTVSRRAKFNEALQSNIKGISCQ